MYIYISGETEASSLAQGTLIRLLPPRRNTAEVELMSARQHPHTRRRGPQSADPLPTGIITHPHRPPLRRDPSGILQPGWDPLPTGIYTHPLPPHRPRLRRDPSGILHSDRATPLLPTGIYTHRPPLRRAPSGILHSDRAALLLV